MHKQCDKSWKDDLLNLIETRFPESIEIHI
jgi:hypothetical protein